MNILSYLSFFTFLFCLFMSILSFRMDLKARMNRAFSFLCFSSAIWALGYMFVFCASDIEVIWFWYKISSIGWVSLIITIPYYGMTLSDFDKRIHVFFKYLLLIFLFLFYLMFVLIQFIKTLFIVDFIKTPFGNAEIIDFKSILYYIWQITMLLVAIFTIIILIKGRKFNTSKKYGIQITFMILFFILNYFLSTSFNLILPLFINYQFPGIGVLFMNIFLGCTLYLMYRYKLLQLDYSILKNEVFDILSDMIILISPENKIIKANKIFCDTFKIKEQNLQEIKINELFLEENFYYHNVKEIITTKKNMKFFKISITNKNRQEILVNCTFFPIFDDLGDYNGMIILVQIMNEYEQIMNLYKITPQERKIVFFLMEGLLNKEIASKMNISNSTVKNYIYNIYQKTNVKNRVELLQLFFPKEI